MGVNDETLASFDEYLSPTLSDNPENTPGISNNMEVDSITATDDLNYLMSKQPPPEVVALRYPQRGIFSRFC